MKKQKISIVIHPPMDIQTFEAKHMKESTTLLLSIIKNKKKNCVV